MDILKSHLKSSFTKALPGEYAHKKMMPEGRMLFPEKKSNPTLSAVLILLYQKDNKIYFPLIKRQKYDGAHSGQMAFPGGKHEKGELLEQTALRECYEEIGIAPISVDVIGQLSDLYIQVTHMMVKPFIGLAKKAPVFKIDPHEVDQIFEINLEDLKNRDLKKTEIWELRKQKINVPFYNLNEQKVWGATAMMLSELEFLLKDISITNNF